MLRKLKTSRGFTLIELVIVIIILGVLAVIAAPKFIDISTDSRIATMKALAGSIKNASTLIHGSALTKGPTNGLQIINLGGRYYSVYNGYADSHSIGDGSGDSAVNAIGIIDAIDTDMSLSITQTVENGIKFVIFRSRNESWHCYVKYSPAESKYKAPKIETAVLDC